MVRWRFPSAGVVLAVTMLCALVAAGIVAYLTYRDTSLYLEATRAVNREEEICLHLQELRSLLSDIAGAMRGFVLAGDEHYLGSMDPARQRVPVELDATEAQIARENEQDLPLYSTLRNQITQSLKAVDEIITVRRKLGFSEGLRTLLDVRELKLAENLNRLLDRLELNSRLRLASKLEIERQRMRDGMRILVAASIVALFFVVLSAILFNRYLAARREVEATVRRANEELESRVLARTEALRQSESKFRLLSDAIPQIVWTATYPGTVQFLNQRWHEYTQLAASEEHTWPKIVHPEDFPAVNARWQAAVTNYTEFEVECRLRRYDGEYRWHLVRALPARDPHTAPLWFGTCTDIHAQKQAIESLTEANRNKEEFLAILSHELRSPLTAAYGWIRLLQTKTMDDSSRNRAYTVIERNIAIQTRIVEALLEVSQLISNNVSLQLATLQLAPLVEQAAAQFRPECERKNVKLHIETQECVLEADADRLNEILKCLLSNAVKFTPSGGAITVSAQQQDNRAVITVTDTGVGIEPDFLPLVFRRFRQADMRNTRRFGGLGLGLYITQRLVELHGGTISVESAGSDRGATFCVKLPLKHVQLTAPTEVPAAPRPNLTGLKLLVIENDLDARELLNYSLQAFGGLVLNAESGNAALEHLKTTAADVVLCDLSATLNDGFWFIRQLRALQNRSLSSLPCIALSASAEPERWLAAFAAGFDELLPKPFQPEELARIVEATVRLRTQV